jgi:hypothetical protein
MSRYFFHVHDDVEASDQDGVELPSIEAAKWEALRGARSLAAEQVLEGRLNLGHSIDVADETGAVVATVTFRDAVAVEG